ncbi:MAG: adenylate kinase [Dehalococcoidia bacterium]|nr:adenylate kinase [Dehalococcoidia bacterium]
MRIIILGPPGAGKGTQAKVVADSLGIAHIASGDLLRDHQERGTKLGSMARSYMQQGLLVPDDVIIGMIEERLHSSDAQRGYVLDGFPRTLEQARALDKTMEKEGQRIDLAVNIRVSEKELIRRLGGRLVCRRCQRPYHEVSSPPRKRGVCDECGGELYQREDDTSEAVRRRIQVYAKQTAPLIQYYYERGGLVEIDGEGSIDEVRDSLLKTMPKAGV